MPKTLTHAQAMEGLAEIGRMIGGRGFPDRPGFPVALGL
jgi:hypothetical protein